jgi:hypothetical protein
MPSVSRWQMDSLYIKSNGFLSYLWTPHQLQLLSSIKWNGNIIVIGECGRIYYRGIHLVRSQKESPRSEYIYSEVRIVRTRTYSLPFLYPVKFDNKVFLSWHGVLIEWLIVTQLVNKFLIIYGTQSFIAMFTSPRYRAMSGVRWINSRPLYFRSLKSVFLFICASIS